MNFAHRLKLVLNELMGANSYIPPESPVQLMCDFYLAEMMSAGPRHVTSHRQQELSYELQQVKQTLIPHLRQHLLKKAGYAVACELRHVFDAAILIELHDDSEPQDPYSLYQMDNGDKADLMASLGMDEELIKMLKEDSDYGRRPNPEMLDWEDILQCVQAGDKLFTGPELRWRNSYGGEPWKLACRSWLSLYHARLLNDAVVYIDKLYSTEHNTGALLNKNPEYDGPWVKHLLDLKFQANDPEELIRHASSYMRKLSLLLLQDRYGRAWDQDKFGRRKAGWLEPEYRQELLQQISQRLHEIGLELSIDPPAQSAWVYGRDDRAGYGTIIIKGPTLYVTAEHYDPRMSVRLVRHSFDMDSPELKPKHIAQLFKNAKDSYKQDQERPSEE